MLPKSETSVVETGCKSALLMQYSYSFAVAMSSPCCPWTRTSPTLLRTCPLNFGATGEVAAYPAFNLTCNSDMFRSSQVRCGCDGPVLKRGRGPQATPTKVLTSVRLDADILEFFKSKGVGYQSRINAALRMEVERNLTARPRATTRKRVAA